MNAEADNPEKKIIIDEDWKSQVEAEKAAARRAEEVEKVEKSPEPAATAAARGPLPPANFTFLVSTLYLQGAMALGLLPNPMTKKHDVHLDQAKHSIDLLTVLQQKSEGNRTPEENDELEAALHELRLAYIAAQG